MIRGAPGQADWYRDHDALLKMAARVEQRRAAAPSIAGYEILGELSRGGQGVVYRAVQQSTGRTVAVKVLLETADDAAEQRLRREIDLVSRLRHEHIVRIYDCGRAGDGRLYLVMEYAEGVSLEEALRDAPAIWPDRRVVEIMLLVCDAVAHAHRHGVIHRDLKPANVRIDGDHPRVLDFGLARTIDASNGAAPTITCSNRFLGSLPWASPEQLRGGADAIDVRSDVYALGVMLYQMLTGRLPHDRADGLAETIRRITDSSPLPPRAHRPELATDLQIIALRCLAASPDRRYQTVEELAGDLRAFRDGRPIGARRDSSLYVVRTLARRHALVSGLLAALVLATAGFGITMTVLYRRASLAESLARQRLLESEHARSRSDRVRSFLSTMIAGANPEVGGDAIRDMPAVLESAARNATAVFADDARLEAEVLSDIAATLHALGEHAAAERHLRRALRLVGPLEPPDDDPVRIDVQANLAAALVAAGRHDEAAPLLEDAIDASVRRYGANHARSAACMFTAGRMLHARGYVAEAMTWFESAEQAYRALHGDEHLAVARCGHARSLLLVHDGDYDGAARGLTGALELARAAGGRTHPLVVRILTDRSQVARVQGDFEAATADLDEAESLHWDRLGDHAEPTIHLLRHRAQLARGQGRSRESIRLLEQALDQATARAGDRPDAATATLHSGLGFALRDAGRLQASADAFGRAVEIWTALFGAEDRVVAEGRGNLGETLLLLGRPDDARAELAAAAAIKRAIWGDGHPEVTSAEDLLARCGNPPAGASSK